MITLNAIAKRLEQFGTNHFFIKSYSFGSPDDVKRWQARIGEAIDEATRRCERAVGERRVPR